MGIGTFVNRSATKPTPTASYRRTRTSTGDLILIAAVIALVIFGMLMLYSASTDFSLLNYNSPTYMFNKQLIWLVIGTLAAFVVSRIDYHQWRRYALPTIAVTIVLLVAVLFIKDTRNGAVRTIFGGSIQPSEMAKLATILYLSVWLYSKRDYMHVMQLGLIPLGVILGGIGGLIYLEPDLSAAVTIFILGGLLFFLAGGELRQIILFCLVALVAGWIVVQFSSTGRARLASYMAGLKDPLKSSDHVIWSLEAVFKGKLFGVGIGNATTKLIGLPFSATDSIFAVIVEELGLVGALGLISLYGILLWRGLVIASRAPDTLGSVMAAGVTFWIVIEAIINMSMMIGLLPVAGNALPFISAGGSNLVSSLTAIGILLSISRQSGRKPGVEAETEERRSYSASADLRRRDRRRGLSRTRRPASHSR
ncbi:MAG TPA: putative peptidoglycan glycosyltransferase FtsW [Anaerolineales bacterium]|nr:putative peptidoglycan glycosyltransferase FtsW [Anaerolineales bacterium]